MDALPFSIAQAIEKDRTGVTGFSGFYGGDAQGWALLSKNEPRRPGFV
jgi:hypothetical protein